MQGLIDVGRIIAPHEVRVELEQKDDEVLEWALARSHMFVPLDEAIQIEVAEILQQYPRLLDTRKNRSGADPFVIAVARLRQITVVTQENPTGSLDKPNIPDVCKQLGIDCIGLLELAEREGWVF